MSNILPIILSLHVLSVVVWVGGMFFAHQALRPAAMKTLEPPQRLPLWASTFDHFFPWVWASIVVMLATGLWMFTLFPKPPIFMHIMLGFGIVMMLIFLHVFFAPYKKLKKAVNEQNWPDGAKALGQIRMLIGINLTLGLITIVVAMAGKYWF